MKAGNVVVDSAAAVAIVSGVGATLIQRRFCAIRVLAPTADPIYIGGSDVAADGSNGFPLDSTFSAVTLDLDPGDVIYAIAMTGTSKTVAYVRNQA